MNWQDYKTAFECDGSLRDIYILRLPFAGDWLRLIEFLHRFSYLVTYQVDGCKAPLPKNANELGMTLKKASVLLAIDIGDIVLHCHFNLDDNLEFNLDPRQVDSETKLEKLFGFMQQAGNFSGKEVVLTEENDVNAVWFRFLPGSESIEFVLPK